MPSRSVAFARRATGWLLAVALCAVPAIAWSAPAQTGAPALSVVAPNSYSARLSWAAPGGAATVEILRNGREIDRFPVGAGATYLDHLLWQATTYAYEVTFFAGDGGVVGDETTSVTTPAQVGAFPRLYAKGSFWNEPIGRRVRVDPNSSSIVATSIAPYAPVANLNDSETWGIPLAYSDPASELYDVGCTKYGCDQAVRFRIPRYARPNFGSDGKLVVVDPSIDSELDMGRAAYDPPTDSWTTASRYTTPSDGWGAMCGWGSHCDGVLMSGIDQFGGIVRPEEIAQGHIDHALALSVPYWRVTKFVCPAVKTGGGVEDANAIPEGAHVQLSLKIDVAAQTWPAWEKVIARALQVYGAYVSDAGSGSFEVRAESDLDRGYPMWQLVGINAGVSTAQKLPDIPWGRMRVLKLHWC
jgi:hypothetical protein